MRHVFYWISFAVFSVVAIATFFWPLAAWSLVIVAPIFMIGLNDATQTRQAIRRNFPVLGNMRYLLELIRPELQQYFVESNQSGRPIPRELRSVVYQRAKGQTQTLPFGTQLDVHAEHYEWINHSVMPNLHKQEDARVEVGTKNCKQPYSASIMNISAMSYGALSSAAVSALNKGAAKGKFYHNTGEGGISPHHMLGADLVWQLGTGYFGCRDEKGGFNEEAFRERAVMPNVKMIEIKLSQGAKPGKGGLLPANKVSEEVSKIRLVPVGQDVVSPPGHSTFSSPETLLRWVARLRELSGGKPVGFKLCLGTKREFIGICKAMVDTGITPDFITVDGGEGGTGAAPLEFSNHVGTPLQDGLAFVVDALRGFNLKKDIRVIASGKVLTSFNIITRLALGADMVNCARGMMLSLGCIQALKCNTNECPTGVATTDPRLAKGLVVADKAERVFRFQRETVHHYAELLAAMGYESAAELRRADVNRRLTDGQVKTYEDLHPTMAEGYLLKRDNWKNLSAEWQRALNESQPHSFAAASGARDAQVLAM